LDKFEIQLTYSAVDDLDCIPEISKKKIIASIQKLATNPFSPGPKIKKLKGFKPRSTGCDQEIIESFIGYRMKLLPYSV